MKICGKCGTHILETAEICWNCKSKVDELPELQPESQPEQPCETQAEAQVESSNMKRCDQCGACIPKTAEMCWSCKSKIEKQPEPPRMKFCEKCGAQMAEDAQVCMSCGCPVEEAKVSQTAIQNKGSKKTRILIIIAAIAAVALIVGAFFLVNHIRQANVIKDLSGKTFRYYDSQSYPLLGVFDYTEKEMKFDSEGKLTYSYYYSNIDMGNEHECSYKIKFKNDMVFLEMLGDEYEIQYDRYNEIEGIYDINLKELFD